jgi:nicotinamidase-related amidase
MVEEITADVSYILLEYAPEEAHPYLTTLLPDATVFPKSFQDPFLDEPFVRHLQQEDIRAVVAVGYDARRCVKSGVQSALKHNFHVITSPNMMTSYDCDFAIDSSLFNEPELACLNEQLKL